MGWGGDDDRTSLTENSQDAPALNRSYKTSFLGLKCRLSTRARLMPDSGPSLLNSFRTFVARKTSQAAAPGWGADQRKRRPGGVRPRAASRPAGS